jgi:predicted metalloprotease with PDZ domain
MMQQAHYELLDMDPISHEFLIRLSLSERIESAIRLSMPAWIPGSYMIRDFARHVTELRVIGSSGERRGRKCDKQTWLVDPCSESLVIEYRVYAFDLSVRAAFLDSTRAFFNGTSLFLRPDVDVSEWRLTIKRPVHSATHDWQVLTTLPAVDCDAAGFGRYEAGDYEQLTDHPVEIGPADLDEFDVLGVPHRFAVSEGGHFDLKRICRDVSLICAEHAAMFKELPVRRYLFLTLATADGYGGLEHRDSTSLICKRSDLPAPGMDQPDKAYRGFLGLCSHEYFHLWNVKRIQPEVLQRADLLAEVHTELLWAFEGITSYYDDLALPRSGVITERDYLATVAGTVTRVQRGAGRLRQSVAESSFDAWTRFYKQDENAPNAIVSYYTKGALVAFGLDMTLRQLSDDALSLDDLMRHLWDTYGRPRKGVPERGVEQAAADLLGRSLQGFFDDYVRGTVELPLEDWFGAVGVGVRLRPAENADDTGGYGVDREVSGSRRPSLGARLDGSGSGLRLTHVMAGGAAQLAGLAPGDTLLALDHQQVGAENWEDLLSRADDETVIVHFFRRGRLLETRLTVQTAPADTCDLWFLADDLADERVLRRRRAWLSSSREAPA